MRVIGLLLLPATRTFDVAVAAEVWGVDRTDAGIGPFELRICSPGATAQPLAPLGHLAATHDLAALLTCDLIIVPGRADPNGIHPLIWKPFKKKSRFALPADKPLTLASYAATDPARAYVEPVAVGDRLPDMPLFLTPNLYVKVPLEAAYVAAWKLVPQRWRDELAPPK